jgi:GntR family transcriptional repressor for pyruvate dehydrogenase complex
MVWEQCPVDGRRRTMLKAVKKRRAYEDIVEQIRELIEKGKLRRGDQLPVEKELSETFKVSRLTVREAILSLETMKLVDRRQGNGTYVIASCEEALVRPLAEALVEEKDNFLDVFAVREIIEPEIARLAASNATEGQVKELERILEVQEKESADKKGAGMNADFHRTLAKMAKNKVLERLLIALIGALGTTREKYLLSGERKKKSLEGHRQIVAAIKGGSPDAARRAMRRHLQEVENIVFNKEGGDARG